MSLDIISLGNNPVFDGTNLSITAQPGPLGGDGLVNVGHSSAINMDLGTVTVKGNLQDLDAGKNALTSNIQAINVNSTSGTAVWTLRGNVGTLHIAHGLRGAEIDILVNGAKLGALNVGGSLLGGTMGHAGTIESTGGVIGQVNIGRDMRGGAAADTGDIQCLGGDIAGVKIGGSLVGGTASYSGRIIATAGSIGPVKIGGNLESNGPVTGTLLTDSSLIYAQLGGNNDGPVASITSISIGGSVVGVGNNANTQTWADGSIGPVKIGRSLLGGPGNDSGEIQGAGGIASVVVGGSLVGGAGMNSGSVQSLHGDIGRVKIGGSLLEADGDFSATIHSDGKLGDVKIGGDVISGSVGSSSASIESGLPMGAVQIAGNLIGNSTYFVVIEGETTASTGQLTIQSLTVGGRVEDSSLGSLSQDARIGAVKVGGDWIASNLFAGIDRGADKAYGTADDKVSAYGADNPALFSKIASITIGGQVAGTVGGTDHYGFVSQQIGALQIHGVSVPLKAGRGNDTDVANTHFILGATRDVTVHEVA